MAEKITLRACIEQVGFGKYTATVSDGRDAKEFLGEVERRLRTMAELARRGLCAGLAVTVHAPGEACDHE